MTIFSVVEFPKYEVEIVSSKWLSEGNKLCKWPKHYNSFNLSKALTEHAEPDSRWKEYPVVKYHGAFETTAEADAVVQNVLNYISTASEAEEAETQVIEKEPLPALPSSLQKSPLPALPSSLQKSQKRGTPSSLQKSPQPVTPSSLQKSPQPVTPSSLQKSDTCAEVIADFDASTPKRARFNCTSAGDFTTPKETLPTTSTQSSSSHVPDSCVDPREVTDSLEFRRFVCRNLRLIRRNTERLALNRALDIVEEEDYSDFQEKLPLESVKALTEFDNALKDKKNFDKLKLYLAQFCSKKIDDSIRIVMNKLLTDKLATKYTFLGKKGKRNFAELKLKDVVLAAVRCNKATSACTEPDLKNHAGRWLTKSKSRVEAATKAAEKKKELLESSTESERAQSSSSDDDS